MSIDNMFDEDRFVGPRIRENDIKIKPQIIQVLPPNGWKAAITNGVDMTYPPLVCWGLLKLADGTQQIIGMVANEKKVTAAYLLRGFVEYIPPGIDYIPPDVV